MRHEHPAELLTIGQVARRVGVPVRTIRFWSDAGVLPPTDRSDGGYRLYDATAVARLRLVRTLRDLGLGLDAIRQLLRRQATVQQVAELHAQALDAEIRTLRLQRAVLRAVARRNHSLEEMTIMHELARLSAQERQRIVDDFVDRAFAGIDPNAPGASIASGMRQLPTELPDDPTTEQVEAWVELAGLLQDVSFQQRVRQMAVAGSQGPSGPPLDHQAVVQHVGLALAEDVAPDSAAGRAVLDRIVAPELPAVARVQLADQLVTFADRRVERFWQLTGVLNGRPPFPPMVPMYEWVIAALRASA